MGIDGLVDERVAAPSLSSVILHVVLLDSGVECGRRRLKSTNLSLDWTACRDLSSMYGRRRFGGGSAMEATDGDEATVSANKRDGQIMKGQLYEVHNN